MSLQETAPDTWEDDRDELANDAELRSLRRLKAAPPLPHTTSSQPAEQEVIRPLACKPFDNGYRGNGRPRW